MVEYISIGQITNTYGIKGELKVYPLTDDISRFTNLKEVFIEKNSVLGNLKVEYAKYLNNMIVIKLKGIDDIDNANLYRNKYIKVHRKDAVKLPEGAYFICDVIGAKVYTTEGQYLGTVSDVLQTGSNDVYIVRDNDKEILIPALKSIFKDLSIENKKMIVELPEGLI